jgi:hypothetical protein
MYLFKDTQLVKLELLSNATTIDNALHYIKSKQQGEHNKGSAMDSMTTAATNYNNDKSSLLIMKKPQRYAAYMDLLCRIYNHVNIS